MPSIKYLAAAALALAAAVNSVDATACSGNVVKSSAGGIDSPTGATFKCLGTTLSAATATPGVPALNFTTYPINTLFQNPSIILTTSFGVAEITGIYIKLVGGLLNQTGTLPACATATTPYYTLASTCFSACGTTWAATCSGYLTSIGQAAVPAPVLDGNGYAASPLDAIASIATNLFLLGLGYEVLGAVVPCLPAVCANVAKTLCAGAYGPNTNNVGIPLSLNQDILSSNFAALSAGFIYYVKNATNALTYYLTSSPVSTLGKGVLAKVPASLGGPFTGNNVTLSCAAGLAGTFGSGLSGSGDASSMVAGFAGFAAAMTSLASM
jgi:hypothetical protein